MIRKIFFKSFTIVRIRFFHITTGISIRWAVFAQ